MARESQVDGHSALTVHSIGGGLAHAEPSSEWNCSKVSQNKTDEIMQKGINTASLRDFVFESLSTVFYSYTKTKNKAADMRTDTSYRGS